jgi:thymidine kinase
MNETNFTNEQIEYIKNASDHVEILCGGMGCGKTHQLINEMQDRINNLKKAITGYQTDVIPKLQKIVDEAKNDEEVTKMANELFIIEDK